VRGVLARSRRGSIRTASSARSPRRIARLELRRGDLRAAAAQFRAALALARNAAERRFLARCTA